MNGTTNMKAVVASSWETRSMPKDSRPIASVLSPCCRIISRRSGSLAPGQVDPGQQYRRAYRPVDPESLGEEHDARDDPDEGDEVLVDEHPVRPDARDPPLPGDEPEGRNQERGVCQGAPPPEADGPPVHAPAGQGGEREGGEPPEEHRVAGDGRSEERPVGKEGRSGWSPHHQQNKSKPIPV